MNARERHELNLFTLQDIKKRYPFTPEELRIIDFVILEMKADRGKLDLDRSGVLEMADKAGKTWNEKAAALFSMAYYRGRLDGSESIADLYKLGYESGAEIRRQRKRK